MYTYIYKRPKDGVCKNKKKSVKQNRTREETITLILGITKPSLIVNYKIKRIK